MSEEIQFDFHAGREEKYATILPQLKAIFEGETNLIANLANFSAVVKEVFGFLWVGFYLVKDQQLILGPFQGPLACTRIPFGKGVCGTAWKEKKTIVVKDVSQFSGHIVCSSKARSEIVVPLMNTAGEVWGVLDIDSENLGEFTEIDSAALKKLVSLLKKT